MDKNELKNVLEELKSCTHELDHCDADDMIADFFRKKLVIKKLQRHIEMYLNGFHKFKKLIR